MLKSLCNILLAITLPVIVGGEPALGEHWARDGTPVCASIWESWWPNIVSDGAGGAIIVWLDSRNENADIYAQRITAEGRVIWTTNGVPVCTAIGTKSYVHFVSDAAGGAIIIWNDRRVEWDIFAQRIRHNGEVAWDLDGVPVSMADDEQKYHSIAADGAGGAIAAWTDVRFGWDEYCIYAQRIDTTGNMSWDKDGVQIIRSTDPSKLPLLVPDGEGGVIVTWGRLKEGRIVLFAQRINEFGDIVWEPDGVLFSAGQKNRSVAWAIPDGAGGAIITWWDKRNKWRNIYAQRIDGAGNVLWKKNDVVVCDESKHQMFPRMVPDGAGGVIIVWHDARSGNWDIFAQRLDGAGKVQWPKGGVPVCTAAGHQKHPRILPDGEGGAVVIWTDERNGPEDSDIYAQRIDASGSPRWGIDGAAVTNGPGVQSSPEAVLSGFDGVIVVWSDGRPSAGGIYAGWLPMEKNHGTEAN